MRDLIGNNEATGLLRRLIASGRVPNALLFSGPEGVGKKLFAMELARALVCTDPASDSGCGVCSACKRVGEFSIPKFEKGEDSGHVFFSDHADVGLVVPFRRNLLVVAIRALEREANFLPYEAKARVFIVEDADKMNEAAANALLKTLEEPPGTSHIILIAARADSLLPTILSRCQTIRFGPVSAGDIEKYLLSTERFSPEDAALAARVSGGSIGRALESVPAAFRTQRSLMLGVLRSAAAGNKGEVLSASEEMSDARNKDDFEENVRILQDLIHDVWLIRNGGSDTHLLNVDIRPELAGLAEKFSPQALAGWLDNIEAMQEGYLVNVNRKIATDSVLIKIASA